MLFANEHFDMVIRPLTVQYKNCLFFGSTKGALNSAIYNTFMESCKLVDVSFRDYFRAVLIKSRNGQVDYESLLPMIIGLKQNN